MQKWEYARLEWFVDRRVDLWPEDKLNCHMWIGEWLQQNFPQLRKPRVSGPGTQFCYIDKLEGWDTAVGRALVEHLGLEGWEAVSISEGERASAVVWLKRPISESGSEATTEGAPT